MLGNQIKNLREVRNLSQVQLAEALHVSKQSISNWENENIFPSIERLVKIAAFFQVSADYLLDSVYMRSSQNSQPNSDTPDMNSRKER